MKALKSITANMVILLDRDGTLNRNYQDGPVYRIELFELLPGAAEAVKILNEMGIRVAIVTNQGGINHTEKDFDWEKYREIEKLMHEKLHDEAGAYVDHVFVCHHADYENCDCRKPADGLLKKAHEKYQFDPEKSFIIGDSWTDIMAGRNFGMKTILVELGWDKTALKKLETEGNHPDHTFPDLLAAAKFLKEMMK